LHPVPYFPSVESKKKLHGIVKPSSKMTPLPLQMSKSKHF